MLRNYFEINFYDIPTNLIIDFRQTLKIKHYKLSYYGISGDILLFY